MVYSPARCISSSLSIYRHRHRRRRHLHHVNHYQIYLSFLALAELDVSSPCTMISHSCTPIP